ncbi:MAG: N-acyl homoserine lactonase family protein [Pseudomonadota bacterium]
MLQTGWVAVKREHRSFSGPSGLRIPAIMTSRSWTEWMPITAYAIEHPDGVFMVDTGETSQIGDPDYTACDAVTGMFYRRNLQFAVSSDEGVARQLNAVDIDPKRVSTVVMTHLHSDHMGGMASFGQARFIIAGAARAGHAGALMCRIPSNLNISTTENSDRSAGVFSQSMPLTGDGSVSVIPTPGHTRGHQSVLIEDGGTSVCIVGDAAFSLNQIENGEIAGIVETVADARTTLDNLRLQVREFGTIMLPAHDPGNAARLRRFTW